MKLSVEFIDYYLNTLNLRHGPDRVEVEVDAFESFGYQCEDGNWYNFKLNSNSSAHPICSLKDFMNKYKNRRITG